MQQLPVSRRLLVYLMVEFQGEELRNVDDDVQLVGVGVSLTRKTDTRLALRRALLAI